MLGGVETAGLTLSAELPEPHHTYSSHVVIWTVAGGLALFVYWAAMTPVYEVVSGYGHVRPREAATRLEHLEGGIVSELHVRAGEVVSAGQPIASLDIQLVESELEKERSRVEVLSRNVTRYEALLEIDFTADNLSDAHAAMTGEDPPLLADALFRLAQVAAVRAEAGVSRAERAALDAQYRMLDQEVSIVRGQLARYGELRDSGAVPIQQIEDLERSGIRLETELMALGGEISVLDAVAAQSAAREREIVSQFRREAALSLDELRAELHAAQQSLAQLLNRHERSVLRSPVAGIVNEMTVDSIGEVLAAGEMVAEIIPTEGDVFAEVEIPADRIGGISVGSEASLKILTYDFTEYGDVRATVEQISPSSFVTPEGETVFRLQLSFDADSLNSGRETASITPGMTVMADIISEERSVLTYILKPLEIVADRAMTEG